MKEILCPVCNKFLLVVEEKPETESIKKKIKIWCKRCNKEVVIEI